MDLHDKCLAVITHHKSLLKDGECDLLGSVAGNEAAGLRGRFYNEQAARAEAIVRRVQRDLARA